MQLKTTRERLLASTMIGGALALALGAAPAFAQDLPPPASANPTGPVEAADDQNPTDATGDETEVGEVIVTGTRIPQPNLTSVSPVTVLGAQEVQLTGATRVEDLVNQLPQAFAAQGSNISNGASGTATVNLRGLGSTRTLVLVDGRRIGPGDPGSPATDLNFIPSSLISRIEVITGGASSVYGSDAVAGVVNFIMQRNFEGIRVDAQYGLYQHDNDSEVQGSLTQAAARATDPRQFAFPSGSVRDGESTEVTLVIGANSADGRGNVSAYAGYRHVEPVLQGNRDYSSCTLNSGPNFNQTLGALGGCGGSGTAANARVGSFIVDSAGPGNTFRPRVPSTDVFNFGPTNYYQRPDDRYVLGAFAHYELNPMADVYADLMFMDDRSTAQIAPGGIFAGNFNINCDNAFLSAQQRGLLRATAATGGGTCLANPNGTFRGIVARRNVEGGGRQTNLRHTAYRGVIGVRGDLNEAFNYDAYASYYTVTAPTSQTAFFQTTRIQNSLIVRRNAAGVPVCQSVLDGTDLGCVPYNIFNLGGVTQDALDYLQVASFTTGNIAERVVSGSVAGDLGSYGFRSPWATDGIGIALGAEYRRTSLDFQADFVARAGLLNGAGGASPSVNGSFDVYELFAETRIPLLQDLPFARLVQLELGYRFSDYSTAGDTDTYKVAGDWEPIDGLRFRAGYNRAVRAPGITDLFSPQNVVLGGSNDPCAGLTAGNPLVQTCATAFNLTTAQVLRIEANPAPQYNALTGGNPDLAPEIADTYTVGVVYRPSFVPNLTIAVDYFDIEVEGFIGGVPADVTLNRCLGVGSGGQINRAFCNLIRRDADGSLFLSPEGFTIATSQNTGSLSTTGVDVEANYRLNLDFMQGMFGDRDPGGIAFNYVATFLQSLETETLPGDDAYDCAGLYGNVCGTPNPEYRHKLRATWDTPFYGIGLSLQWRYFASVDLDATDDHPELNNTGLQFPTDNQIDSQSFFDLSASFRFRDNFSFRAGVNNIFDRDPPIIGGFNLPVGVGSGNTFPQVYDALGRFLFVRATADF